MYKKVYYFFTFKLKVLTTKDLILKAKYCQKFINNNLFFWILIYADLTVLTVGDRL